MLHGRANRDLWDSVGEFLGTCLWAEYPRVGVCVCVCVSLNVGRGGTHTEVLDVYQVLDVGEKEKGIKQYSGPLNILSWREHFLSILKTNGYTI